MGRLPTGTVTFLFTDIEGSTKLLQELGEGYEAALNKHRELLRAAFAAHGGREMRTEGDSFFIVFERASDAVAAALDGQLALTRHRGAGDVDVRVRMGIHTGEAQVSDEDYIGLAVHQAARISDAAHGGQVLTSQTTKDLTAANLPEGASLVDLGEHRLKDLAQPVHLYNLAHAELHAELPPPRSLSVLPNNLPLRLTTFVGREDEVSKVKKLLGSTRLLTLAGTGGSGKTRLALHVAADLVTEYPNGVWLTDLAPVTDPELIVRQIAESLGVREEKDRPVEEVLLGFLQGRELLSVVDNCEHLAEEAAEIIDRLLHGAAGLTVMTTSREPLGAEGETVFRVPSLDTPGEDDSLEAVTSCEAVQLFRDRAAQTVAGFEVGADNARAITEICRRLDGMPLAIELAAARVRMLTPQEIAKRLDDRFKLLTGGVRTGFRRQQTLRATVDWSYELLTETEQRLFRRLAVFVRGFSLEAAEAVCSGDGIQEGNVFDLLANLVDRSLVIAEPRDGQTRYRMLETMREYGREALSASGEASRVWDRHLVYFTELAEEAEPHLEGGQQAERLARLTTELENIRQALSWATTDGDAVTGVRLATAMGRYWDRVARMAEGARWLDDLYASCRDDLGLELRAKTLMWLGHLLFQSGQEERGQAFTEECVDLPRKPETLRWIGEATNDLGLFASFLNQDIERHQELAIEALALRRQAGHDFGVAESLHWLSVHHRWTGDHEEGERLEAEALAIYERIGNTERVAEGQSSLAGRAAQRGDFDTAIDLYRSALSSFRELGDTPSAAGCLSQIARVHRFMGDFDEAEQLLTEAEQTCRDIDHDLQVVDVQRHRGQLAMARGDLEAGRHHIDEYVRRMKAKRWTFNYAETYGRLDLSMLCYFAGDIADARTNIDRSVSALESYGYRGELAYVRTLQARITRAEGHVAAARELFMEARELATGLERPSESAIVAHEFGLLELEEGNTQTARSLLTEALRMRHETNQRPTTIESLEAFGWLECVDGHPERAAMMLGAAGAARRQLGITLYPIDEPPHEQTLEEARRGLGEESFERAWASGEAMTLDEAVAYVFEEA